MIDKCEAIAWLANIKEKYIHGGDEEFDECRRKSIDMAIKALRQPQIVRCKDCKKRYKRSCGYFYADGRIMCDDWFCADGVRKEE